MTLLRKHLLREKKNKSICRYHAIDLSLLGPPHAFLFVIGTAPASWVGWWVFRMGFLLISVNLSQKAIPPGLSRKAVICALMGLLCLVSPTA